MAVRNRINCSVLDRNVMYKEGNNFWQEKVKKVIISISSFYGFDPILIRAKAS